MNALLLLLGAAAGLGQVLYGSVTGTVVDGDGRLLPGVVVTLSGPAMQSERTARSDASGRFRFVPVPPGDDYTLVFESAGFATVESVGLNVDIDADTFVRAQMARAEFADTLVVAAADVVVDTSRSTTAYTLDAELQDTLPDYRNFRLAMLAAPGVRNGNNPFVNGGSNDANLYLVDGVDTTDPRTQTWTTAVITDTIAEAEVQTAGFTAEWGRASGGILNVVTKSGGNAFSAMARWRVTDADWSARDGVDPETGGRKSGFGRVDEDRPVATFGGPIVRDALWFFVAYERTVRTWEFAWYRTAQDQLDGVLSTDRGRYDGHDLSGKLTWQPDPSNSVAVYYDEAPGSWGPLGRSTRKDYSESTDMIQNESGRLASLRWTGVVSPAFLLEVEAQVVRLGLEAEPDSPLWDRAPFTYDLDTAYFSGGPQFHYRSDRSRDGFLLNGSYYVGSARSSHQVKSGVELIAFKPDTGITYNDLGYYLVRGGQPLRFDRWTEQSGSTRKDQDYTAVFVQDTWRLGRLTMNLGVRAERVKTFNNVGESLVTFSFEEMVAPRLGFAYDLGGDVVRGSLARFYQMPSNYIADYLQVTSDVVSRYRWNETCPVDGRDVWTYDPSCWRLQYSVPSGATAELDPGLEPASVDEATLGFETPLSNHLAAGINVVLRQQDTAIDWYGLTGSGYYLITNMPQRAREDYPDADLPGKVAEYRAVSVDLRKRLGPEGLQLLANYTYAWRDKGWESPFGLPWRVVGTFAFTSPESVNRLWYGRSSSPHSLKILGSYTFPTRTVVGVVAAWGSGRVYTPVTYVGSTSVSPIPLAERGSLDVGSIWEADLYLEQGYALGPVVAALYVNVLNAFNNQQPTERGDNADTPSTFMRPIAWQAPRSVQLGFKIEY